MSKTKLSTFCCRAALALTITASAAVPALGQFVGQPSVSVLSPATVDAGGPAFTLSVIGSQFQLGSAVYASNQPLPTTLLNTTQLSAQVPAALIASPGPIQIFVLNSSGFRSNIATLNVGTPALTIATTTLPAAQSGVAYSQTLSVNGGTSPYTWTAVGALPSGLALSSSGQLSGTPSSAGSFTLAIRVTDAAQRTATSNLTLQISPPTFSITTPAALASATEATDYRAVLQTANGSAPVRWSTGGALPPGLTLDAATGVLSGTPTTRGTYSFPVQASDATGAVARGTFTLVVQAAPLAVTTLAPLFEGTVGSAYSQQFSASGGTAPYSWSLQSQVPNLTLDPATGVLAGTPDQAGSFGITVSVRDAAGGTASKSFVVVVQPPQLRITNTTPMPSGTAGTAYQQRFLVTGGRAPYFWSVAPDVPGITLNTDTGVWSGTPTAAGTFPLTVFVRDSSGASTSRVISVTIAPGPLRMTPAPDLLRTLVSAAFTLNPSATGGMPPYAWSVNGLPEGLELNTVSGEIAGTPRSVGSYLFTVRVTDAARQTATELYRLEVAAPDLPSLSAAGLPAVAASADQSSIRLQLGAPYTLPIDGELMLGFAPDSGSGDPAIQFAGGGRRLQFRIPAGATEAEFAGSSAGLQTGTVAGVITLSARLETQGVTLTPTPVNVGTVRVDRTAPVIRSATFVRNGNVIEVRLTGYSNSREATQAVFRFSGASGVSLTRSEITVPVEETFGRWFRDAESAQYGGQFTFVQQFTIDGDANAVTPTSVVLTNRVGNATADVRP